MSNIYKFEVPEMGTALAMPNDYKLLTVMVQKNVPCIWIQGSWAGDLPKAIDIWVEVTGGPPIKDGTYIGSYQVDWFVGHVFIKEKE